ncbi:hypothetical protein M758_5G185900 [Ceratodon purpureus]|nr:hypothetical protein M758_5G185900 [Ceratodon purpureus]
MAGSPNSRSAASSSKRWEKSAGGATSTPWRSSSAGSSSENWRSQKSVVSGGDGSWNSRTSGLPVSPDSSVNSPRGASRKSALNQLTDQVSKKSAKVFLRGRVLTVNYERKFGFLAPSDGGTSAGNVYFRVSAPGDQLTSTLTGGMLLIPGDTVEYELANSSDSQKSRAHFARLCDCKFRSVDELEMYVKNLTTTAEEHPELVLRDVTKCPVGFKLMLDYRYPSNELLGETLKLCQILSSIQLAGLYRSRLKQIYALFSGSQFLTSDHGVRKFVRDLSTSDNDALKDFLLHLLEYIPSQLPLILPLLMRLGKCQRSGTLSLLSNEVLPILDGEDEGFLVKSQEAVSLACEAESFLRKVLNVLGGGSNEKSGISQPWSQLPLLPTMEEVRTANRSHLSLPVVKQKGPYMGPEEYVDTYLSLLREDSVASLLQGIHALRKGKVVDCDLKLWFHVSTIGVHFNHNVSPGLTFAVRLPKVKGAKDSKRPLGGSLVCFFDDSGGFDTPVWGIVSRCEEEADKTCVCFVDIVVQSGAETELNGASWSFQCARLIRGDDMVMAESPTYYKAYQPVLEALQLTDPDSIPFREELVFVTWPEDPAPEYLKSASGATLDWSCIFGPDSTDAYERHIPITEGVGAMKSLLERGYKTSFDASQLKAVELAVSNRLTIIQGPPGTGKTYIGVKLLQLLLSASTFPQGKPVFVVTMKNHALDQFLEKCLSFCKKDGSIVRVGGRSKSRTLEKYNLQMQMAVDDEFRFDRAENYQHMETVREEMESALFDVNRNLECFDPQMILVNAPELHLNYFLQKTVPSARIETCVKRLPEGVSLAELIQGQFTENFDDAALAADVLDIQERLVAEMGRWIPRPVVLQTAQAFLSMKKPSSSKILQAHNISSDKDETDEEQDESSREEEERRSAYESLRQDINLEPDAESKKTGYQWLANNFMKFPKKQDVGRNSIAFHRLNRDNIGSQFDWLAHENPYDLSADHRAILVLKYWQESVDAACELLARIKAEYDTLLQDTEQILERRKLAVLQKAKIIGMTTTGAAIHQRLLKHLSPAVVLVEEAAEILEPQVLASLNSNVQHLILIGDHHQLRPQVESYDLERWHGFGVSMFERLVEHKNLPYQALALQCRMREEFVPMLLPIYPYLKSHTELVSGSRNEAPTCMGNTMYFWSHVYEETTQRSYVNQGEAQMVVALTRWIVSELENPQSLKILAAYNGQVTLIRKLLEKYPELQAVEVRSIDSFQGVESEIVIVSLVRSNAGGNIGHLRMRNRLCVAASRARCGVYFVGNDSTLAQKNPHWKTLISYFVDENAIDSSIPLCCPRHPDRLAFELSNTDVSKFEPSQVCDYPCGHVLPCKHSCNLTCHSGDNHGRCIEPVNFTFWPCGHSQTRKCYEDEERLSCKTKIMHEFVICKHITEMECWQVKGSRKASLKCRVICGKELKCGHLCKLQCSEDCASVPCKDCQEIEKEKERIKLQILIKAIDSKRKELDAEIQKLKEKGDEGIVVKQVHPDDDTALSYFMAKDRVEKYILPDCKTMVVVTKVQKIENLKLQAKFLNAQRDLIDPLPNPEWLFYAGSDELITTVVDKGFRAAHNKALIFHVYSSKIAEKHDNHSLLLSEVHLGKTWRSPGLESVDQKLNGKNLRQKGYDSISLVGDQETGEELRPLTHIIFNPDQAIPRFIVSYKLMDLHDPVRANEFERFGEDQASKNGGIWRVSIVPSLNFQGLTPEEIHFRMAESQFFRMLKNRSLKVTKVDFIKNLQLEERFDRKKEEFKSANVTVDQRFVFHGTDAGAIDKIAIEGFKIGGQGVAIKCGASYGYGVYTAVNPDISVAYCKGSNMMLLSIAIPGENGKNHNHGGSPNVLVIKDVAQLLPRYVVHYS